MKKRKLLVSAGVLLFSMGLYGQTFGRYGLNTNDPAATWDVGAVYQTGTSAEVDGTLFPRVDRQRAQSMRGVPLSTMIYVNSVATGTATGTAANIDTTGFYYFNGTVWTKLIAPAGSALNLYNSDGTLTENRTVTQGDKTLAFTGTAVNAFSVGGNAFSVDAANKRIGIGLTTPNAPLQLQNTTANRKIVLYEGVNNDHQYYGLGINPSTMRYQVDSPTSAHIFYAAQNATSSKELVRIVGNGNVGIGTGAPGTKLEINNGSANGAIKIVDGTQGSNKVLTSDATGVGTWKDLPAPADLYNANGALTGDRTVSQGDKTLAFTGTKVNAFSVDGATFSVDAANDRVGLGTVAPSSKLNVVGGSLIASKGSNPANPLSNSHHDIAAPGSTSEAVLLRLVNTSPVAANNTAFLGFNAYNGGGATWGIGSTQSDATANNSNFSILYSNGGTYHRRLTVLNNGSIGVGTATPQKLFHINGALQLTNELNLGGNGTTEGSAGTAGQILTSKGAGAAPEWKNGPTGDNLYNADGSLTGNRIVTQADKTLAFTGTSVNAFSVAGNAFSVDAANKRVGIGTGTPVQKLDVASGNVRIKDINSNQGSGGIDKIVVADANGVLKTVSAGGSASGLFYAQLKQNQNTFAIPATLLFSKPKSNSALYSYNVSTGILTFNQAGYYQVNMQMSFSSPSFPVMRYIMGIRPSSSSSSETDYIARGSKFASRPINDNNPTIGDIMTFTTAITVPYAGYSVRFVAGSTRGDSNGTATAVILATESGTSGDGTVSNISIQKI